MSGDGFTISKFCDMNDMDGDGCKYINFTSTIFLYIHVFTENFEKNVICEVQAIMQECRSDSGSPVRTLAQH